MLSYDDRSLSEAARQKVLDAVVVVVPGPFGPSRKKEAAARRFGNYELWVLNAAMIRAMLVDGRMRGEFCRWLPEKSRLPGNPEAGTGTRRGSQAPDLVDEHTSTDARQGARRRDESAVSL